MRDISFHYKEYYEIENKHKKNKNKEVFKFITISINDIFVFFLLHFFIFLDVIIFYCPFDPFLRVHFMTDFSFYCTRSFDPFFYSWDMYILNWSLSRSRTTSIFVHIDNLSHTNSSCCNIATTALSSNLLHIIFECSFL